MIQDLQSAIGRTQTVRDHIDPARANALLAALGRPADLAPGSPLPGLHHWLYFWNVLPPQGLGRDGHPKRGGFVPALPDEWPRMWAGGAVEFLAPLPLGEQATCVSTIKDVVHKTGRTGELVFVTVQREVFGSAGLAVRERQDQVYRAPPSPGTPPTRPARIEPSPNPDWRQSVDANSVLLFRYSALTLNGHRIHYDQPYATQVEGYDGLVIHGPLQATLMLDMAERELGGPLSHFEFRGFAPACDTAPIEVCGSRTQTGAALWTQQSGALCMSANAVLRKG